MVKAFRLWWSYEIERAWEGINDRGKIRNADTYHRGAARCSSLLTSEDSSRLVSLSGSPSKARMPGLGGQHSHPASSTKVSYKYALSGPKSGNNENRLIYPPFHSERMWDRTLWKTHKPCPNALLPREREHCQALFRKMVNTSFLSEPACLCKTKTYS